MEVSVNIYIKKNKAQHKTGVFGFRMGNNRVQNRTDPVSFNTFTREVRTLPLTFDWLEPSQTGLSRCTGLLCKHARSDELAPLRSVGPYSRGSMVMWIWSLLRLLPLELRHSSSFWHRKCCARILRKVFLKSWMR